MYMRWLACLRICWILQAIAILDCSDAQPCGFKPTFKLAIAKLDGGQRYHWHCSRKSIVAGLSVRAAKCHNALLRQ
eukprot:13614-Heterococcus_DN1.PRE.2